MTARHPDFRIPNPGTHDVQGEVRRFDGSALGPSTEDLLATEAPLTIVLEDEVAAVTLRTPGEDDWLVRGFLLTDGWVERPEDVASVRLSDDGTHAHVALAAGVPRPAARATMRRGTLAVSSCGLCGRLGLEDLYARLHPPPPGAPVPVALVRRTPRLLAEVQPGFARTGGLHAAAALQADGTLRAAAEDVGRHNAVDKVVGGLCSLPPGLASPPELLVVSGRVSFEVVAKAARAGIGAVLAISAPSSAAVALARQLGMLLCAFVRDGRFNVYSGAERLA